MYSDNDVTDVMTKDFRFNATCRKPVGLNMEDDNLEVVRRVSRTPRGGVRMVKEKVSKVVGFRESIATTSTATSSSKSSSSTRKSIEADGDSKEDKTSPVIKRRRLSERTNMTPKGINKRGRGNIDITPSRKTPINRKITPGTVRTRSRTSLEKSALWSPGVEDLLSQEDSFLAEFSEQLMAEEKENKTAGKTSAEGRISRASEADMFEESDKEQEQEAKDRVSPSQLDDSQLPATGLPPSACSGLPASFFQVKQAALEDLKTYVPTPAKPEPPPRSQGRLIDEGKDVGPFYGLPSKVVTLYQQHKRVTELFDWQKACLSTQVCREPVNLLQFEPRLEYFVTHHSGRPSKVQPALLTSHQ